MSNHLNGFLGSRTNPTATQKTTTKEGGNAYEMTLEEQLHQIFAIGLMRGNFYTKTEDVIKATRETFEKALKEMPYVATQHAVYGARLGMKLAPTIWLVYVSTLEDKSLFKSAFPEIIRNPKMLHDFMEIARKGGIRKGSKGRKNGMGQAVKKTVNKWIYDNLNEYNSTRYTGKLEDVVRLTRPEDKIVKRTGKNGEYEVNVGQLLQYVFKPKDTPRRLTFDRAQALQVVIDNLNKGQLDQTTLDLIEQYKMQLEELKHTFGKLDADQKKTVFMYFVPGLRYMALVSNLVAIERAFATRLGKTSKYDVSSGRSYETTVVMETEIPAGLKKIVADKLSDFEDYKATKMLPFRLLTAHEMTIVPEWREALNKTLAKAGKVAFQDIPDGIKVRVSADTSGSMSGWNAQVTDTLKAIDIASYFAAMIGMSITGSRTYATASWSEEVRLVGDNLIQNAARIARTEVSHGTNFESLLEDYAGEKFVILITDGEDASNMERKWASLKKPEGARLIIWRASGPTHYHKVSNRKDILHLQGYNDTLLKAISNMINGKVGSYEEARKIVL